MTGQALSPIGALLDKVARKHETRPALSGLAASPPLSHGALDGFVRQTGRQLRAWGIGRGDIVLIAVPDGPEALTAFLSVASAAIAFPVPTMEAEAVWARIFDEIEVRAVLMADRPNSPLTALTAARGAILVRMTSGGGEPAGYFQVEADRPERPREDAPPGLEDDAIFAMTAGSTSVPKIVASTQASFLDAVRRFSDWNALSSADRALCVMPFPHLHSLVRSSLPVLIKGGEVNWAPGFRARDILNWIDRTDPTFMTGAPAVFRALLKEAEAASWTPADRVLDVVGIGSDKVDPALVRRVRHDLNAHVFQFYGMTETAPFIAMTPRNQQGPDGAAGVLNSDWDVTVLSEDGMQVGVGKRGEIAVRGGHINRVVGRSGADRARFDASGRFLTGDLGYLDTEGFLYVEGRVDDRINRGGEKIVPEAVETVLRAHPDVARAAVFGVPDQFLGQRVVATVELRPGRQTQETALRTYAASQLPSPMVPERVLPVDKIPTSEVGKVSRRALSADYAYLAGDGARSLLNFTDASETTEPMENELLEMLRRYAQDREFDFKDRFFERGGDSLSAIEVLMEIERRFDVSLSPAAFLQNDTVSDLAALIATSNDTGHQTRLEKMGKSGLPLPLILAPGVQGSVEYAPALAKALGSSEHLWVYHAPRVDFDAAERRDVMTIGAHLAELVSTEGLTDPISLGGFSMAAHVALGMAHHFTTQGRQVSFLGIFDDEADLDKRYFGIDTRRPDERSLEAYNKWALDRCAAKPYPGRVTYFRSDADDAYHRSDPTGGWGEIALGGVTVVPVTGSHESMLRSAGIDDFATSLSEALSAEHGNSRVVPLPLEMDEGRQLRYEARVAARRGVLDSEIGLYRRAAKMDPEQPFWAFGNLAEALFDAGDAEAGRAAYREALARDPWPLTTDQRFAARLRETGFASDTEVAIARARRVEPDHVSVLEQVGHFFAGLGLFEDAEPMLRRGIAMDPTHLLTRVRLAELLKQRGQTLEAANHIEAVVDLNPSSYWLYEILVDDHLETGRPECVLSVIERSPTHVAKRFPVLMCRGHALLQLGRHGDAIEAFREAAKLRPAATPEILELVRKAENPLSSPRPGAWSAVKRLVRGAMP